MNIGEPVRILEVKPEPYAIPPEREAPKETPAPATKPELVPA